MMTIFPLKQQDFGLRANEIELSKWKRLAA